jgi:serine-type D-Ala-D-Ala carboxypeptidase (penicillin-binding protein 5/6)
VDLHVLQQARQTRAFREARRRRERRIRRARRAAIVALMALGALLVILATTASGPLVQQPTRAQLAQQARLAAERPKPRPLYGRIQAKIQVNPGQMKGLRSGMLFDVRTGQVMWERAANDQLPIASLTKMMTALVVVKHSKESGKVMISKQAIDFTGSGVGLLPLGKRVPEKALLYGLLLPSGNDAAIALAQHVARTQAHFVAMMNVRARQMGLGCSHFATVSGVVDQDNYSCPTDLAVIAHAVLTNRTLAPIVSSATAEVPFPIKGGKLWLTNNNPLLRIGYPGIDGVKTGYTTSAGLCIVATARRGPNWLGAILLHSPNWQTQAETLLNAGFRALRT